MRCFLIGNNVAVALALLSAGPAFTQIATAGTTPETTASPIAYVYVQTTKGIEAFSASSTGKLTLVSGSPFADSGQMGAINGSYLFSVGTDYIHTYSIESNGAVGKQVSEIDTQKYGGAACGTNAGGALLDHTGKYLYVMLTGANSDNPCSAMQSYKVGSSGDLTYLGDSVSYNSYHGEALAEGISTISGNDNFAYGTVGEVYATAFTDFTRESSGLLAANSKFTEVDPKPNPAGTNNVDNYFPLAVAADPTDHLAALMYESFASPEPPPQLASYTINDSTGAITSTNAWDNMPTPAITINTISMSPTGKQLAVAGQGIEIYNFNGASPLTLAASMPVSARDFGFLAWDKNDHLYAVDYETGDLYVYTIGASSITAVPGSPYTIPDNTNGTTQYDLIVVPK